VARIWWFVLAAGAVAACTIPFLGNDLAKSLIFNGVTIVAAGIAFVGIARNRPRAQRAWVLLASGLAVAGVGDLVADLTVFATGGDPARDSPAALVDGVAYLLFLAGLILLATRGRPRQERYGLLLDACVVASAASLVAWEVIAERNLGESGDRFGSIEAAGYVVLSLMIVLPTISLFRARRRARESTLLILAAVGLLVTENILGLVLWVDDRTVGWFVLIPLAALCGGAAALHPSMGRVAGPSSEPNRRLQATMFAAYGFALVLPALLVMWAATTGQGSETVSTLDLAVYLPVIGLLLLLRIRLLMATTREANERFRQYFSLPLIGLAITAPDKHVIEVNDRLCEMLGRPREEWLELTWADVTHPDDLATDDALWDRVLAAELDEYSIEKRYLRPDGATVWANVSKRAVRRPDGTIDYFVSLIEDITDRHAAEQLLADHMALQDIVTGIAGRFVNVDAVGFDRAVDAAIEELARFVGVDRSFVYFTSTEKAVVTATREWCAEGLTPQAYRYVGMAADATPRMFAELRAGRNVVIDDRRLLGDDWAIEGGFLDSSDIASIVMVPMMDAGRFLGTIGFATVGSARSWRLDTVDLLGSVADVIAHAIARSEDAAALTLNEARYRTVVEAAPVAILTVDADDRVLSFNAAAEQTFALTAAQAGGRPAVDLVAPTDRQLTIGFVRRFLHSPDPTEVMSASFEISATRADGSVFPAELTVGREPLPGQEGYTCMARDISEQRALEEALTRQALTDPLTGLANRVLLLDRLSTSLRRAERRGHWPALLFIDLDRFKVINDSLGHEVGDRLLVTVATRLAAELRQEDTASRLGGDEFVALCDDIDDIAEATALAQRILDAICRPIDLGRAEAVVTASIGVVMGEPGADAEGMLRDADASMYRAKDAGRNRVELFSSHVRDAAVARLAIESGLRTALAEGELRLHYQPQWAVDGLTPTGAEALVRWQHPVRGLLYPGEFLPVAEETGLNVALDRWVLGTAARQAATWSRINPEFVVWVNLSARLLVDGDLPLVIERALAEANLPAANLGIEVTETSLVHDLDTAARSLERVRRAGVHVAIDDFGTGFSSLSWLERLPLDLLKIDRSFTDGLGESHDDTVIVTSVIAMAHSLGLGALAEGVETAAQYDLLRELGCDELQGYLCSRPVPAVEIDPMALGRTAVLPN